MICISMFLGRVVTFSLWGFHANWMVQLIYSGIKMGLHHDLWVGVGQRGQTAIWGMTMSSELMDSSKNNRYQILEGEAKVLFLETPSPFSFTILNLNFSIEFLSSHYLISIWLTPVPGYSLPSDNVYLITRQSFHFLEGGSILIWSWVY